METTTLEMMCLYLLNMKAPNGKLWVAITIPGIGRFSRSDVERALAVLRTPPPAKLVHWWQFWKR